MAIEVSKDKVIPELNYNNVFLEKLELDQEKIFDTSSMPIYNLRIIYRMYAIHDGKHYYETKTNSINIKDYFKVAVSKAQVGDPDLLNAAQAIEVALAKILIDQTDLGTATIK